MQQGESRPKKITTKLGLYVLELESYSPKDISKEPSKLDDLNACRHYLYDLKQNPVYEDKWYMEKLIKTIERKMYDFCLSEYKRLINCSRRWASIITHLTASPCVLQMADQLISNKSNKYSIDCNHYHPQFAVQFLEIFNLLIRHNLLFKKAAGTGFKYVVIGAHMSMNKVRGDRSMANSTAYKSMPFLYPQCFELVGQIKHLVEAVKPDVDWLPDYFCLPAVSKCGCDGKVRLDLKTRHLEELNQILESVTHPSIIYQFAKNRIAYQEKSKKEVV
jgi:hypothetical protein